MIRWRIWKQKGFLNSLPCLLCPYITGPCFQRNQWLLDLKQALYTPCWFPEDFYPIPSGAYVSAPCSSQQVPGLGCRCPALCPESSSTCSDPTAIGNVSPWGGPQGGAICLHCRRTSLTQVLLRGRKVAYRLGRNQIYALHQTAVIYLTQRMVVAVLSK